MTDSMTRYETTFESTENLIRQIVLGHGENADLVAGITDNGTEVDLTGYAARAIYQPRSKWDTDDWYECPCEISGNKAVAHWGNTYDNGDNAVRMFIHLSKNGKVAYPALYQMRLFETPGFAPSAITPIPETIDFSQYTLVNAPWLPLAGGTLAGDVTTSHNIIHTATRTVTYKNIETTDDMENYYVGDVLLTFDSAYQAALLQTDPISIPVRITGTLKSTSQEQVDDVVLTDPTTVEHKVHWKIVGTGMDANDVADFTSDNGTPVLVSANIHGDYCMGCIYRGDTTGTVTEVKNYIYDGSTFASKAELQALVTGIGDPALLVKKDRNGQVGHEGGILNLKITGDDDEYPLLEFDDTAEGGDVYVLMTNGPGGEGGEWHEIYLPNHDGFIGLVPNDKMAQQVIDAPPRILDNWGSGNETHTIRVVPENYWEFERTRYVCGDMGAGVKKLRFDVSGIRGSGDDKEIVFHLLIYRDTSALPSDVFEIADFSDLSDFEVWTPSGSLPLPSVLNENNHLYAVDVHFNESYNILFAQVVGVYEW